MFGSARCWLVFWSVVILLPGLLLGSSSVLADATQKSLNFGGDKSATETEKAQATVEEISDGIESLKREVIGLNKELRLVEEELLFPSNTQFSVFVTLNVGKFFTLESIKLKLDNQLISAQLYSPKQRQALARGGVQKLMMTNLSEGDHTVTAFFTGLGPNGRPFKRAQSLDFTKTANSQYLELAIVDDEASQEPEFTIKQW